VAQGQDVQWQRRVEGYFNHSGRAVYHGGMEYTKPVFADLDDDGDGDLYVGEHDGYLNIFINEGGDPLRWTCITTALDSIDVGKHNAPTFWDVDLDGDLDLFIGDEDGDVWHYLNEGTVNNPSFTLVTENYIAPLLVDYHAIPFFVDLDADNDDDLLIGHNEGGAAQYMNAGSPGSPAWSFVTSFYSGFDVGDKSSVCVFDVDEDDLGDIFMAGVDGEIFFLHNQGPPQSPTYNNLGVIFDVGHNGVPTFWDIDDDGDLDLVAGESDGNLNLLLNTGTPSVPHWALIDLYLAYYDAGFQSMPVLTDIDSDDDLDLFIGRLQVGIVFLENVGTPDSAAWQLQSETYADLDLPGTEAPAFHDLNDDGDPDLLVGGGDGTLTYLENIGTPHAASWRAPVYNYEDIDVGENAVPAMVDADGDGDVDLFIGSAEGTLRYFRNEGSVSSPVWLDLGDYPGIDVGSYSTPAFADLDRDGDYDLIMGNGFLTGFIALYRNQGTPLLPSWSLETPNYQDWDFGDYSSPCFGDLDDDGDAELIIGCEAGGLWYWENAGLLRDVSISLFPYDPPVTIPPEGGSFDYVMRLENHEAEPLPIVVWTTITLPDGQVTGAQDSLELLLQPGATSDLITQDVPREWPAGEYAFNGHIGLAAVLVYDSDSFNFTKDDTVGVSTPYNNINNMIFHLADPYPNPFNSSIRLHYTLPRASEVELALFDTGGREVALIFAGMQSAGDHFEYFSSDGLASGLYFVRMQAKQWIGIKKIVHLR
jgi:hypothetical protein